MAAPPRYPVFIREGDGIAEVDALVADLGSPETAGLHRCFFVTRANQTVVMALRADSPLAAALRARPGWQEPEG